MKVRLNKRRIKAHCTATIGDYVKRDDFTMHLTADGQFYLFQDNGANILAVAHLDTVNSADNSPFVQYGNHVWSMALDDRLGVYIITEVLPVLGIECDILLTVGEESCRSTAAYFEAPRQYNWVVEFDRKGDDVVTYQYADTAWHEALQSAGAKIGMGCYTDIAELHHLKVACVNFGCGYKRAHTKWCNANLKTTRRMITQFADFYWRYHATQFACDAAPSPMVFIGYGMPERPLSAWERDIIYMDFDEWRTLYDPGISRQEWMDLFDDVESSLAYDYCDGCLNLVPVSDMYHDAFHDLMYCASCDTRHMYSATIVDLGMREGVPQYRRETAPIPETMKPLLPTQIRLL